jgi:hypothetical protein
VTNPWPDAESLDAKLGGVFDEALNTPKTGQEILDDLLVLGAKLRLEGALPPRQLEVLERLESGIAIELVMLEASATTADGILTDQDLKRFERCRATGVLLSGASECARAWLHDRHPLQGFIEHWRTCVPCQAATPHVPTVGRSSTGQRLASGGRK